MVTREQINMARYRATTQAKRKAMCKSCLFCLSVGAMAVILTMGVWL